MWFRAGSRRVSASPFGGVRFTFLIAYKSTSSSGSLFDAVIHRYFAPFIPKKPVFEVQYKGSQA
jgi:hypothetical protein